MGPYEAVIGLEVHAQLLTRTKAFCGCATSFGASPNTHVCPVCLGLPGALPVLNREAVNMAVRAALALGCTVHPVSVFARKNYFYPDLPKGYQISQFDRPLATGGRLLVEAFDAKGRATVRREARIHRIHMEEDAGKNVHGGQGTSLVDLNRAGTPLIEIVGEPDLRSSAEAAEYLRELRAVLMSLRICDGNMEEGSFRCDVNVSVRPVGSEVLGTRTEIKNVNSFRFVQRAIDHEVQRQSAVLGGGGEVEQETRGWDDREGRSFVQRSKEEAHDYRYFTEPDLPALRLDEGWIETMRAALPALPAERRQRYVRDWKLTTDAATVLTSHPSVAALFEAVATLTEHPVKAANFIQSEVLRDVVTDGLDARISVTAEQVASLLLLVEGGTISGKQAKDVYVAMRETGRMPEDIVEERGMRQLTDESAIEEVCRRVIASSPAQVEQYRMGKANVLGYLVGQVMKETRGSANPKKANEVLLALLADS